MFAQNSPRYLRYYRLFHAKNEGYLRKYAVTLPKTVAESTVSINYGNIYSI